MMELSKLSQEELSQLNKEIDMELMRRYRENLKKARRQMRVLARTYGLTVAELVPGGVRARRGVSRGKAAHRGGRLAHPSDPSKTWSGRGRKPNWLKEWEAAGHSADQLRIA
jgi:DNA-binding protein H-NS